MSLLPKQEVCVKNVKNLVSRRESCAVRREQIQQPQNPKNIQEHATYNSGNG